MSIVGNALDMAWNNELELKSSTVSIVGSSELTTMPWTNVKIQIPSRKGRTQSAIGLTLTIDFGVPVDATRVIFSHHNLTAAAGITVQGSSDEFFSSSSALAISSVFERPAIAVFDSMSARYWRLLITDSGNADGYIEIGHVFIGTVDQFELPDFAISFEPIDPSIQSVALNGAMTTYQLDKFRKLTVPIGAFQQDYHRALQSIYNDRGIGKGLYIITDPGDVRDTEGLERGSMFGTFASSLKIGHMQSTWHQSDNLVFEELRG